uniref:Uncharacterized protein n=1 Tax=Mimivirus LCMiAC01 TaxID=2506608 RepID=A0A481YZY5_9VIRU|nr:MAG: uncharacterized protein LCMiAC01_04950 [Mimivirus LCMiAC01]
MPKNKTYINGPVNVVRLEGKVGNINKVIYLFMDFHMSPAIQTECEDVRSTDVKDYFVRNFDKISTTKKTYDFFIEHFPTKIVNIYPEKDNYLTTIRTLMGKSMNIQNGKVKKSKIFPNIRFHYVDIRDYTKLFHKSMDNLEYYVYTKIPQHGVYKRDIDLVKDAANILTSHAKYLYDIFYSTGKNKKMGLGRSTPKPIISASAKELEKYTDEDYDKAVRRLINKMMNLYKHKNIKSVLNDYIYKDTKEAFDKYFKYALKLDKLLTDSYDIVQFPGNKLNIDKEYDTSYGISHIIYRNLLNDIQNIITKFTHYWWDFQLNIMDVYLLRRFLDKDYITNGIVYSGAKHSTKYIYLLVKKFGFKITHASYLRKDIDSTMDVIKKSKNSIDFEHLFYRDILHQCSDMTSFPELFN